MPSKINKLGFALVTILPLCFSSFLGAVEPIDPTGEYYYPPVKIKKWVELTPKEQQKAAELKFDRAAFAKYLINSNPNPQKWGEAMGYTQPKK